MIKEIKLLGKTYANLKEICEEYDVKYKSVHHAYKNGYLEKFIKKNSSKYNDKENNQKTTTIKKDEFVDEIEDDDFDFDLFMKNLSNIQSSVTNDIELNTEDYKQDKINNRSLVLSGDIYYLLTQINKYKPKVINLIDFENVANSQNLLEEYTNDSSIFNIFFYNACIYSNNFYKTIKYSKSVNFQILTYTTSNQLVDKLLIYYLGILESNVKGIKFNIVSRDYGFSTFLECIDSTNITVSELEIENNKELKFVKTLCTYLSKNKYVKGRRYYTKSDLKSIIEPWFLQKNDELSDPELDHLIHLLCIYDCIKIVQKAHYTNHLFNMQEIDKLSFKDKE